MDTKTLAKYELYKVHGLIFLNLHFSQEVYRIRNSSLKVISNVMLPGDSQLLTT
jgi:hypothetical protein